MYNIYNVNFLSYFISFITKLMIAKDNRSYKTIHKRHCVINWNLSISNVHYTNIIHWFFPGLPDPFAKIDSDSGQVFTTDICKASVDPKWSSHYDLYLSRGDGITISVWNQKKIHKTQGSGFLGCVRITASTVQRLKDTGCKYLHLSFILLH